MFTQLHTQKAKTLHVSTEKKNQLIFGFRKHIMICRIENIHKRINVFHHHSPDDRICRNILTMSS